MQARSLEHSTRVRTSRSHRLRLAEPATDPGWRAGLDRVLELLERGDLNPAEIRLLLALVERDEGVSDLAQLLGRRPKELRRLGARLYARGLLRWREAGDEEPTFGITRAGLLLARPFLTAAELSAAG